MKYALRQNSGRVVDVIESGDDLASLQDVYVRHIVTPLEDVPQALLDIYEAEKDRITNTASPRAIARQFGVTAREVRIWAKRNHYEIADRGTIPEHILKKYLVARRRREQRRGIPF